MTRPAGMPADFRSGPARVIIATRSGEIRGISTTIRDLVVSVFDMDKAKRGEISSEYLTPRTYGEPIFTDDDPEPALSPEEIQRFAAELDELPKLDTITLFATVAATVPGGTAALRDWLTEAEAENGKAYCEVCEGEAEYDGEFIVCPTCDADVPDPPEASLYPDAMFEHRTLGESP